MKSQINERTMGGTDIALNPFGSKPLKIYFQYSIVVNVQTNNPKVSY